MLRRSFRFGLRMGLVAGVLVVVVKVVQARRSSRDEAWPLPDRGAGGGFDGGRWPPVQPAPVEPEPPATTVTDRIPPVKKATETAVTSAPPATPAPPDEPPPATSPVAPGTSAPAPAPAPVTGPQPVAKAAPAREAAPSAKTAKTAPAARRTPGPDVPAMPAAERGTEPAGAPAPPAAPARPLRKDGTRRRVRRTAKPWIETTDHDCPPSHPVKAKLSSMLYHLPGMAFYNRTRPDRCYVDAATAEADGFTRAKR